MKRRTRLLTITAILALSIALSGCIFPNNTTPSNNTTDTDRTLTITPINQTNPDDVAAATTTQYNTLNTEAQTALRNGSVTTVNDLNQENSPYTYYTYNGSVYRLDKNPAGTTTQIIINTTITRHKNEPSEWETERRLNDYPRIDQTKLKPQLNKTAERNWNTGGGRGGPPVSNQFTYDTTLRYTQEANNSEIIPTDKHNILYDYKPDNEPPKAYTLYTDDQQRRTVQLHTYTAEVIHQSNKTYTQAFAANNTVNVSLTDAEQATFNRISQTNGPVPITSQTERSLAQKFERYKYPTAYYTGTKSITMYTRVDGQLYQVTASGPNVPSPFNTNPNKNWTY